MHALALRGAIATRDPNDLIAIYSLPLRPEGSLDFLPSDALMEIANAFPPKDVVPLTRKAHIRRTTTLVQSAAAVVGEENLALPWKEHALERLWSEDLQQPERAAKALLRAAKRSASAGILEWGMLYEASAILLTRTSGAGAAALLSEVGLADLNANEAYVQFVKRLISNAKLPRSDARAEISLLHHDKGISKIGDPFVSEVRIRNTSREDLILGGASGVSLQVTLKRQGEADPIFTSLQPLPLAGLLPGEETHALVILPTLGLSVEMAEISFSLVGPGLRENGVLPIHLNVPVR
jgi:hypothetical protein